MRRLAAILLAFLAAPAATAEEPAPEGGDISGLGLWDCAAVSGAENTPALAAAVDWGLGYLAGRLDAGQERVEGEPLSTGDAADLAVGVVLYCRENPHGVVIDALRAYGLRVFGEGPPDDPSHQPNHPRTPPTPRPAAGPSPEVLARIEAARLDARLEVGEAAAAGAVLSRVAGPVGLAARMAAGVVPGDGLVSRAASGLADGLAAPEAAAAPEASPRPPWRTPPGPALRPSGPL